MAAKFGRPKLFKCIICDNFTIHKYLGKYVHQTCFDYMVPIIVKKFNVHNYIEVMRILVLMRNLQDGFLNPDISETLINVIIQKIEMIREP